MGEPLRVAATLEQCWHPVPGGTAVAALELVREVDARADVEVVGVAGRHRRPPLPAFAPPVTVRVLPIARPLLYEMWNRAGWPKVEGATGEVDVVHSTTAIPAATDLPHVATVHDIDFVHHPERFTPHGVKVMTRGLDRCRDLRMLACPTRATADALVAHGFDHARIEVVPWGVGVKVATDAEVADVRRRYELPDEFVLHVGTLEPRKNLPRIAAAVAALAETLPLVVAGAEGWGESVVGARARFLGFVPTDDLAALYRAATVFAYPSLEEGFGLPILEAMAQSTPVVTSTVAATSEVAGDAAVLVDPGDTAAITRGIALALADRTGLAAAGRARAQEFSWVATGSRMIEIYRAVAR